MMFKACTPLGRSSHPSTRNTNREPEGGEGERGRERKKGMGRLDVRILNQTNYAYVCDVQVSVMYKLVCVVCDE